MPGTWLVLTKNDFLLLSLYLFFFPLRCREGREGRGREIHSPQKDPIWMDVVFGLKRQNPDQAVTVGVAGSTPGGFLVSDRHSLLA